MPITKPVLTQQQEIDLLRDALDHIRRTALSSRTQTRRIQFIADRAVRALKGKPYDPDAFNLPSNRGDEANANSVKDASRYRKLRNRDQLTGVDFAIEDLTGKFGPDMDMLVDQLPALPLQPAADGTRFYNVFPDTVDQKTPEPGIYWDGLDGKAHGPFDTYAAAKTAWRAAESSLA